MCRRGAAAASVYQRHRRHCIFSSETGGDSGTGCAAFLSPVCCPEGAICVFVIIFFRSSVFTFLLDLLVTMRMCFCVLPMGYNRGCRFQRVHTRIHACTYIFIYIGRLIYMHEGAKRAFIINYFCGRHTSFFHV